MTLLTRTLMIAAIIAAGACLPDPVHEHAVARLGDETPAGPSEFHRAGQPCATCHNAKDGPARSDFSAGGTIFATRSPLIGVEGVVVELTDSAGTSPVPVATNCAGNFWFLRSRWNPVLPIVSVRTTKNGVTREMKTLVGGAASCADCHEARATPNDPLSKLGPVVMFEDAAPASATPACPVDPVLRP